MALRSTASAKSNSGGNLTATPPGVQAHDYLGAFWAQDANPGAPTYPSGWNQRVDASASGPDGQDAFFADKLDASGSDSFLFSTSAGNENMLQVGAWSGRDNTTPRTFAQGSFNTTSNATPVSATATGGTSAAGDDVVVWWAADQTVSGDVWGFSNCSINQGTLTEQIDDHTASWTAAAMYTLDNVSSGATGSAACTITRASGTGNAGYRAVVVSIKAAAGGGGTVYTRTLTDSISVNDSPVRGQQHGRVRSDAINVAESLTRTQVHGRIRSDAISVAEAIIRSQQHGRTLSDPIDMNDAVLRFGKAFRLITDTATITDQIIRSQQHGRTTPQESITVTESLVRGKVSGRVTSDPVTVSEIVFRSVKMFRLASDSIDINDSLISQIAGIAIRILTDSISVTDAAQRYVLSFRQILDAVVITDAVLRSQQYGRTLTDSIAIDDTVKRYTKLYRLLTDNIEVNDSLSSLIGYAITLLGFVEMELVRHEPIVFTVEKAEPIEFSLRKAETKMRVSKQ